MAKLYKMTMYICDLESDLSLEEMKANIDNVLSGISIHLRSNGRIILRRHNHE